MEKRAITMTEIKSCTTWSKKDNSPRGCKTVSNTEIKPGDYVVYNNRFTVVIDDPAEEIEEQGNTTEEEKTMNENRIYMSIEEKINGNYQEIRRVTEQAEIEHDLSHDLIAKKLHKCTYIKSIKDTPLYDGTRKITVTYNNNIRRIYRIEF